VLGIIGRNGAGKSTLLKLLTRITEPTSGRAIMRGRVASLLEVGTGFHPELTGRENVYLNGAILGMKRAEITRKFDEIVDFSGVEKFIDTPVKRYSSGMYVRLAFAVAAHLDPEILLVDEVLAVGDIDFQKKCLGKMGEVAKGGRTVLFVSHNMGSIKRLSPKCLWIDEGKLVKFGETDGVVDSYTMSADSSSGKPHSSFDEDKRKSFQLRFAVVTNGEDRAPCELCDCDRPISLDLKCQIHEKTPGLYGYLQISRSDGTVVMVSDSFDTKGNPLDGLPVGMHAMSITIPPRTLGVGRYSAYLNFTSPSSFRNFNVDSPGKVAWFTVVDTTSERANRRPGFFSTLPVWELGKNLVSMEED